MHPLRVTLFVVLGLALASAALAQTVPGADDPEYKEIVSYKLTLPAVQKMSQATRNLAAAIRNDPRFKRQQAIEAELSALQEKAHPSDADGARMAKLEEELDQLEASSGFSSENTRTLSDMAAALEKEPAMAKALSDAGVEPREYATFMLAYFQAAMVHGMMKSGLVKEVPAELANSVNMDNVAFVAKHQKELDAIAREMAALRSPK